MKKIIKRGELLVNGETGSTATWVAEGDRIELLVSEVNPPKSFDVELEVVFEDEHMAVVNKPAGIPVSGNQYRTVQNTLISNLSPSSDEGALPWPRPAHRLDALTSGLLIIGKTAQALRKLGEGFEQKSISKKYMALVHGKLLGAGTIKEKIEGKPALTTYKSLEHVRSLKNEFITLVELSPLTGRTHQLRKHLAFIGHPIIGDPLYSDGYSLLKGKGLFLSAVELTLYHPVNNEVLILKLPVPPKFLRRLNYEQLRWDKFNPPSQS